MKTNNALVTYTDLSTMGLTAKGSPATGNRIATKQFINDNYYANQSLLSSYASNQCPPYQAIAGAFGATVALSSGVCDACNNPGEYVTVTGNGTTFCNSTTFTSAAFTVPLPGNYVLAYGGNSLNVSLNGTTTATMYGGGCQTCPTTNPSYASQGYQYCSNCVTYNVYRDANSCSPTYTNYFIENGGTYTNYGAGAPPNTGACNTSQNWVNNGSYTCVGCDKHYVEVQNNPCASQYGQTRTGGVAEYNSTYCCPATLSCYRIVSSTQYRDSSCYGLTITETIYTVFLYDQYNNPIAAPYDIDFSFQYDYGNVDELPICEDSGTTTGTLRVHAGNSAGQYTFETYVPQACCYSSVCNGSCYSYQNNIIYLSNTAGLPSCP